MIRTDTDCDKCEHKKVCKMADRPKEVVEHLDTGTLEWRVDDEELDIVVSCINYEHITPIRKTYRDFGFDCK